MKLWTGLVAMAAGFGSAGTHAAEATRAPFGTTPDGVAVEHSPRPDEVVAGGWIE